MKIGNWNVTDNTIEWTGDSLQPYIIEQDELLAIEPSGEFAGLYTAILQATEEDWLTVDDLYDLNYAFVYAAAQNGAGFNYETFDATVAKIFELLDLEDDEQVSQ
ncbi:MAG: hypothetical protein EOP04_17865 [Proteobacteria bacterium]|nr:MAG: hypothetical protein EOP04_17865 [Pseudomonadota bacterium]